MKKVSNKLIFADIELSNSFEIALVRHGYLDSTETKKLIVNVLVDTDSYTLAINENIQAFLQLPLCERRKARQPGGQFIECDIVGPIHLRFQNRITICSAIVLPGNAQPVLGYIPLQDLDVVIDNEKNELIVNPDSPDTASTKLKQLELV